MRVIGRGPGSTRHSSPSSEVAHTEPAPTATAVSELLPSSISSATRLVRGSIRVRLLSQLTVQTPSSPAAIVFASTSTLATILPVRGSMRDTPSSGLAAHTAPAPTAIPG